MSRAKTAKILKMPQNCLQPNQSQTSQNETFANNNNSSLPKITHFAFKNAEAVLHINKIITGAHYNAEDIWELINDDNNLLPEKTRQL